MTPNPQQQLQALTARSAKLADELDERLRGAQDLEKITRNAAHDLERASAALQRDEETLVIQTKQALENLLKNRQG